MRDDPSYWIHTSESHGDFGESWAAGNATQSMLPVEPVVDFRMTSLPSLFIEPEPAVKTSYPPQLAKPDAVDDYTPTLCLINKKKCHKRQVLVNTLKPKCLNSKPCLCSSILLSAKMFSSLLGVQNF